MCKLHQFNAITWGPAVERNVPLGLQQNHDIGIKRAHNRTTPNHAAATNIHPKVVNDKGISNANVNPCPTNDEATEPHHHAIQEIHDDVISDANDDPQPINVVATNPMTLINEFVVDPNSFQKRREFWLGETSGKDKVDQTKPLMKGTKAERRKQIKSALYTLSNYISDSAFHNCN